MGTVAVHLADIAEKTVDATVDYLKNVAKSACQGLPPPPAPTKVAEPPPAPPVPREPIGPQLPKAKLLKALKLRKTPAGAVLRTIELGAIVEDYWKPSAGWCQVRHRGTRGWLWCEALQRERGAPISARLSAKTALREAPKGKRSGTCAPAPGSRFIPTAAARAVS